MSARREPMVVPKLLDLLLPPVCPGCGREGEIICDQCRRHLVRRMAEPVGVPLGLPSRQPAGIVQLEWCAAYTGPARACLHALKYDGERRLVGPLAELMAERWRRAGIGGDVLVPVPVHAARKRQRGFDQAVLLARGVGQILGLPVVPAIRRSTRTTAQHQLGRRARAANVGHAFAAVSECEPLIRGSWAVVVDDLTTTGATFAGCARVLYDSGASAVSALALARER
jgi:ComF family protein